MALIVAARFETFDAAEQAAAALMRSGVKEDELYTFWVNPAGAHDRHPLGGDQTADPDAEGAAGSSITTAAILGIVGAAIGGIITSLFTDSILPAVAGAGVGAYIGSLAGAMRPMGKKRYRPPAEAAQAEKRKGRPGGVLLAVRTTPEHEIHVARMLRDSGGIEVERANGRWENGRWQDFDPLVSPELEKNI